MRLLKGLAIILIFGMTVFGGFYSSSLDMYNLVNDATPLDDDELPEPLTEPESPNEN